MAVRSRLRADYVYWEGRLQSGLVLGIDETGRWTAPLPNDSSPSDSNPAPWIELTGKVILPGLINAHSHAFQRLLRGRTEHGASGAERDDFWSWREEMYRCAGALDPDSIYRASRQAFLEMMLAGVTTVGEFHYLQHAPDGEPYSERNAMARAVIRAAREVGLRIVLLRVGYGRAGHGRAVDPRQRRFIDADAEQWIESAGTLRKAFASDPGVAVGLAPHSVRAVPRPWLEILSRVPAAERGPVHMHVAEQPAEVVACRTEYGLHPVELLNEVGLLGRDFTAVHGVELSDHEIALLGSSGAHVCACPLTERNLGDGVVPADELVAAGVSLCLGSDSQAQIDLFEEARALECHLRLVEGRRVVLDPRKGSRDGLAERLLAAATSNGAAALGIDTGQLAPGRPADFFTLDLSHPNLAGAGADAETLLSELIFGASPAAVRDVAVEGEWRVRDGVHPAAETVVKDYAALSRALRKR